MENTSAHQSILKQYRAGLKMLQSAVDLCPDDLWLSSVYPNRFWHIAYHSLFYTHLYAQPAEADFQPWTKHVPNSNYLGPQPWAKDKPFQIPEPYGKADIEEYWQLCSAEVEKRVPLTRLDAPSGFSWLPFDKFELQLYNIRHLQHHAGQLTERLRSGANVGVNWAGSR